MVEQLKSHSKNCKVKRREKTTGKSIFWVNQWQTNCKKASEWGRLLCCPRFCCLHLHCLWTPIKANEEEKNMKQCLFWNACWQLNLVKKTDKNTALGLKNKIGKICSISLWKNDFYLFSRLQKTLKKQDFDQKRGAKHQFAGQNLQQVFFHKKHVNKTG